MDVKLGFKLVDFAKANRMGMGAFRLKDGSSIKILSNPRTLISHVVQVKNGKLLSAASGRGNNALSKMIWKYEQKAENIDDVFGALKDSFSVIA